jgi:hypothetical protein
MTDVDIRVLTADDFAPEMHQEFCLQTVDGDVPLKLSEVRRHGQALRPGGAFSLLFVATAGPIIPQATYRVRHPTLGMLDIFIVPIGPVPGGAGYEAVFT